MEGNEALYQYKAHQGDPAYVKLGQRLASRPGETTFKSVEEGLNLLSTGMSVLHISEGMLKSYLKSSPPGSAEVQGLRQGSRRHVRLPRPEPELSAEADAHQRGSPALPDGRHELPRLDLRRQRCSGRPRS